MRKKEGRKMKEGRKDLLGMPPHRIPLRSGGGGGGGGDGEEE